ncbi:MAG: hypothetical protein WB524_02380 [Acidobacteriaceae bacterium]
MPLLDRYDPPAFLADYNVIPGQLDAWHHAVSSWFDAVIAAELKKTSGNPVPFYNAASLDPGGVIVEQAITWNAFPKEMLRRFGRDRALLLADKLWPVERYNAPSENPDAPLKGASGMLYRPQEEYCEWQVVLDPDSNKIQRVTFTSEPPEYWQALYGEVSPGGGIPDQFFPGDHNVLLQLYRELVSPLVQIEDLLVTAPDPAVRSKKSPRAARKTYNIYNKWNTTHGIAHLNSPPNSLAAEIQLGADASLPYLDPQGRLLVEPEALISCANYGGPNRNSDPTIGASVNALARLGAYVTLRNPVGLYMDHIDLSGWRAPDGGDVADCIHIIRGTPGMVERQVVEVPRERGFQVGDITINGIPIRFGGQIAECISVKLVGAANIVPKPVGARPVATNFLGIIDPFYPTVTDTHGSGSSLPAGMVQAFAGEGSIEMPSVLRPIRRKSRATLAETFKVQFRGRAHSPR